MIVYLWIRAWPYLHVCGKQLPCTPCPVTALTLQTSTCQRSYPVHLALLLQLLCRPCPGTAVTLQNSTCQRSYSVDLALLPQSLCRPCPGTAVTLQNSTCQRSYSVDLALLPQSLCRPCPGTAASPCHSAGKAGSCHSCVNMQPSADTQAAKDLFSQ